VRGRFRNRAGGGVQFGGKKQGKNAPPKGGPTRPMSTGGRKKSNKRLQSGTEPLAMPWVEFVEKDRAGKGRAPRNQQTAVSDPLIRNKGQRIQENRVGGG